MEPETKLTTVRAVTVLRYYTYIYRTIEFVAEWLSTVLAVEKKDLTGLVSSQGNSRIHLRVLTGENQRQMSCCCCSLRLGFLLLIWALGAVQVQKTGRKKKEKKWEEITSDGVRDLFPALLFFFSAAPDALCSLRLWAVSRSIADFRRLETRWELADRVNTHFGAGTVSRHTHTHRHLNWLLKAPTNGPLFLPNV